MADDDTPAAVQEAIDQPVDLDTPEAISVSPSDVQGPGDFPSPGDSGGIQVADTPSPGLDLQLQYPWSLQLTAVYRNLTLAEIKNLNLDFVHEPNIQLSLDPSGRLSVQEAITLVNWNWMPPWSRKVEVGLQGLVNTTILPNLSVQYGGQLQAEQHIVPWFSITLSATGAYTPPLGGQPGKFEVTGAAGALIHFDAL